jgi:hypothetical protein
VTAVDWSRYRKCPVGSAEVGKQCLSMTGNTVLFADRPHSTRKLRTGYARTGGSDA